MCVVGGKIEGVVSCYASGFCDWKSGLFVLETVSTDGLHNCQSSFYMLFLHNKTLNLHINIEKHIALAVHDIFSSNGVTYV